MKKNTTKKTIVFILSLFVFTGISVAEVLDSAFKQEAAKLEQGLDVARQQTEAAEQVKTAQETDLMKNLYPLFEESCAEEYIREQLAQNSNWRIKRIKDNGTFENTNKHSYTIISETGWKTFRCDDTWSFQAYIDLNKNPKDYQVYLALLKARKLLPSVIWNYTNAHSKGHCCSVWGKFTAENMAYYMRKLEGKTCEYDLRYFLINDIIPEDIDEKTYNGSTVVSYYPYAKCDGEYKFIYGGTPYYRVYESKNAKQDDSHIKAGYYDISCNSKDSTIYFIRYRSLFGGNKPIDPLFDKGKDFNTLDPEDIQARVNPKYKSIKTFKIDNYMDESIGVKCKDIPEEVFEVTKKTLFLENLKQSLYY
jgi:hypothetical protein